MDTKRRVFSIAASGWNRGFRHTRLDPGRSFQAFSSISCQFRKIRTRIVEGGYRQQAVCRAHKLQVGWQRFAKASNRIGLSGRDVLRQKQDGFFANPEHHQAGDCLVANCLIYVTRAIVSAAGNQCDGGDDRRERESSEGLPATRRQFSRARTCAVADMRIRCPGAERPAPNGIARFFSDLRQ